MARTQGGNILGNLKLVRITNKDGLTTRPVTETQKTKHGRRNAGSAVQKTCWVCRLTGTAENKKNGLTCWCCSECGTPLCNNDRCVNMHRNSASEIVACNGDTKGNITAALKTQFAAWSSDYTLAGLEHVPVVGV